MMQTLSLGGKDDLNHKNIHHFSNGTYVNNNADDNGQLKKNNDHTFFQNNETNDSMQTNFEKLVDNIKNNPAYRKEIALERLIGFYRIGSEIGIGNFSQVKLGLHLLTKEKVAIKILNKTKLDEKTQRLLLREISSMQKLHHQNIIRLYEVIHTSTRLYICMEYAPDGELFTRINDSGKIKESEARIIFSQIISAVNHMHSNNIIHRDIKAENIFFANFFPIIVKVGDFGFSIEATITKQLNTYCGSPPYAAPELFRDDTYLGIYVDIWALGVLLYFMVTSLMPFKAETVGKLKRVILSGEYVIPGYVSDSCQLLIRGILKPVPSDRFNIKEIMESAWLDGEKFSTKLEPYQLNPTKDKHELKPEEVYTLKYLENIGITKEFLVYSNLKDPSTFIENISSKELFENSANIFTPANPQSHYMNNLITKSSSLSSNSQFSDIFKEKSFTNLRFSYELKQSINGTYRIVFHLIQKTMLNEYNSEQIKSKKENNIINDLLDNNKAMLENQNRINKNSLHRQSVNFKREFEKANDDEGLDEDSILVKNFKKQNLNNNNNNINNLNHNNVRKSITEPNTNLINKSDENKSIFIRLNSSPGNKLAQLQENGREPFFQKKITNGTQKDSKRQVSQENGKGFKNNKTNSKISPPAKQASKFCTIL